LKFVLEVLHDLLGIKILAGENVYIYVTTFDESMNTDMAFGDKNESGYSPVFRLRADVFKNVRR
jgi:hypothetical protein